MRFGKSNVRAIADEFQGNLPKNYQQNGTNQDNPPSYSHTNKNPLVGIIAVWHFFR